MSSSETVIRVVNEEPLSRVFPRLPWRLTSSVITLFTHHAHNLIFLGRNYTVAGDPRRLAVRVAKVRGAAVLPDVFELAYDPRYLRTDMPDPVLLRADKVIE